jgi:hypothetical protein
VKVAVRFAAIAAILLASCTESSAPDTAAPPEVFLRALSPVSMTGQVGTVVPNSPTVIAEDAEGRPVAGVTVTFASTTSVLPADRSFVTHSDGIAMLSGWMIATKVGDNEVTASVKGKAGVRFSALGTAGPAAQILKYLGDGQVGSPGLPLTLAPTVRVSDKYDNAVAGMLVRFIVETDGARVTRSEATTDSNGLASAGTWTLGVSGVQELSVQVQQLASVKFNAVAIPNFLAACNAIGELLENVTLNSQLTGDNCRDEQGRRYQVAPVTAGQDGVPLEFNLTSTDFDTRLMLVDSLGDVVAINDNLSGSTTNSGFQAYLPAKGSRLVAAAAKPEGAGRYQLSYADPKPDYTGCHPTFVYRGFSRVQSLSQYLCNGSQYDQFLIMSTAGRSLTVEVLDLDYSNWYVTLVAPNGDQYPLYYVPGTYKYEVSLASTISGIYRLEVSADGGSSYKLTVR